MNEKLNIQDLSVILAKQRGLEKEKAENFVREFFALIGEALETDKYLKIKGFGVFKLIEVESRESVNIQTKERFEIKTICFTLRIFPKAFRNQIYRKRNRTKTIRG